jgi:transposase
LANNQLAAELKTTRTTVIKWRERYRDAGLEGVLEDAPRSGRKTIIDEDKEREIVKATLETNRRTAPIGARGAWQLFSE